MLQAKIIETNLDFYGLNPRNATNLIVIHHTGTGGKDLDMSAAQIHDYHLSKDWAGIGYHFVVRKDGSMLSLVPVIFSFGGIELLGITAGEAENPDKTIPKATRAC